MQQAKKSGLRFAQNCWGRSGKSLDSGFAPGASSKVPVQQRSRARFSKVRQVLPSCVNAQALRGLRKLYLAPTARKPNATIGNSQTTRQLCVAKSHVQQVVCNSRTMRQAKRLLPELSRTTCRGPLSKVSGHGLTPPTTSHRHTRLRNSQTAVQSSWIGLVTRRSVHLQVLEQHAATTYVRPGPPVRELRRKPCYRPIQRTTA